MKALLRIFVALVIAAGMLIPQAAVFAQDMGPTCTDQNPAHCPEGGEGAGVEAQAATNLKLAYSKTLKGGYVAHGVNMRATGSGTIIVDDVPAGAKVVKAYLLWSITGPAKMAGYYYNKGKINGVNITASLVGTGSNPRWPLNDYGLAPIYAFRADVTGRMIKGGNGTYNLSGFASGTTESTAPLLDGATLIIVYSQTEGPLTTVKIYTGATTTGGGKPQNLHLTVTGINTGEISGMSQATFIVAHGQSGMTDQGGSFFDANVVSDWSGNGLDVRTVDLTSLITPPENDFWFTVSSDVDGVTWIGQVVSYSSGNQDSDGDKLKDAWELFGINGVDLPGFGADPLHKDLFIEADYMTGHDHLLDRTHLQDIVNVFANAPVNNPDGTTGINIHIDTGGAAFGQPAGTYAEFDLGGGNGLVEDATLGAETDYGDYDWTEFQEIKNANFDADRLGIFHYMIFAHDLTENPDWWGISGISRNGWPDSTFAKGATDFIVSMGTWDEMGTQDEREGTFIHELGHNLGLRHGGNDHMNYKPQYFSVMNYFYQTAGIYRDGTWFYDYSREAPTISETALNEMAGIPGVTGRRAMRWFCPPADPNHPEIRNVVFYYIDSMIDWDCDGWAESSKQRVDTNGDWKFSSLKTQNNWASITFAGGGGIGTLPAAGMSSHSLNALMVTRPTGCLTNEDAAEFSGRDLLPVKP